jgi:hypothetical protein
MRGATVVASVAARRLSLLSCPRYDRSLPPSIAANGSSMPATSRPPASSPPPEPAAPVAMPLTSVRCWASSRTATYGTST